jgi:hypothetical protein
VKEGFEVGLVPMSSRSIEGSSLREFAVMRNIFRGLNKKSTREGSQFA